MGSFPARNVEAPPQSGGDSARGRQPSARPREVAAAAPASSFASVTPSPTPPAVPAPSARREGSGPSPLVMNGRRFVVSNQSQQASTGSTAQPTPPPGRPTGRPTRRHTPTASSASASAGATSSSIGVCAVELPRRPGSQGEATDIKGAESPKKEADDSVNRYRSKGEESPKKTAEDTVKDYRSKAATADEEMKEKLPIQQAPNKSEKTDEQRQAVEAKAKPLAVEETSSLPGAPQQHCRSSHQGEVLDQQRSDMDGKNLGPERNSEADDLKKQAGQSQEKTSSNVSTVYTSFQEMIKNGKEEVEFSSSEDERPAQRELERSSFRGQIREFLKVQTPPECKDFEGTYRVVPGRFPNGYPLWRHLDGSKWIFGGLDNLVLFGTEEQARANFICAEGIIASVQPHENRMPHQLVGWQRDDDDEDEWVEDDRIKVIALSPGQRPTSDLSRMSSGRINSLQSVKTNSYRNIQVNMDAGDYSSDSSDSEDDEEEARDQFEMTRDKLGCSNLQFAVRQSVQRFRTSRKILQSQARVNTMMVLPTARSTPGYISSEGPTKKVQTWS